jgi:hypothetical protein
MLPGVLCAEEAKILSLSGNVEVRPTREGQWTSAAVNTEIAEGGAIRTNAGAEAELLMPNKTKVWLKESSNLELEQRQTLATRLALVFGRIKMRVPHLLRNEKFEVRTPAAVCAVRGTEFTLGTNEDGKMDLQVLFGEVKLKFTIPPEKGSDEFNIPQGQGLSLSEKGKQAKPALLTAAAEREALENWNPGLKPEDRQKDLKQKENDRAQVREFAAATNNTEARLKSFLNVVKESDLEAGRTLTDVHGNLVRVDQRMMRPEADQIQFFNLVKRPVYNNDSAGTVANGGFSYNGAQGVTNRLDYMQMTMAFNKDLPQSLSDWPSFFNANSVKPAWASFVLANRTDPQEIFFIAEGYKYQPATDDLRNNTLVVDPDRNTSYLDKNVIITGVLTDDSSGITAIDGLGKISKLQIKDANLSDGRLVYTDASGQATQDIVGGDGNSVKSSGNVCWAVQTDAHNYEVKGSDLQSGDSAKLYQYQADQYDVGNQNGSKGYFWFAKENYGLGNAGNIKTVGDFTNSSSDPFSILKDSALETVMYIKQSGGAVPASNEEAKHDINNLAIGDYFAYGTSGSTNIDVVFIPDLMVAAVQRMLPAISNLKN